MAPTIGAALHSLRGQTVEAEVVLVDSGSTDGTVEIARGYCDKVLSIAPADFSYGRALNLGVAEASGEICFALSAHRVAPGPRWVQSALEAYEDERVAATAGETHGPDGRVLMGPTTFCLPLPWLATNLDWGLSNTASSWRRSAWESEPFNEGLDACEDKEWMWRVLAAGWSIVADPRLHVPGDHRRQAGWTALYRRVYRERRALAELVDFTPLGAQELAEYWLTEFPYVSAWPRWTRVVSPYRAAELMGRYMGERAGARRRGPGAVPADFFSRTPIWTPPAVPAAELSS
jgi:rhamnosyltransferase